MHLLAKEFGMPPSVALQEDAFLLDMILIVQRSMSSAEWAATAKIDKSSKVGKNAPKTVKGGNKWRRRKAR